MTAVLLLATAWGPLKGGVNAFNLDLAHGLAKLPGAPTVFCAVPKASPGEVADAAAAGIQLLPIDASVPTDHFDNAWVYKIHDLLLKKRGKIEDVVWVGHDLITGPAALQGAQLGGRAAIIRHTHYLGFKSVEGASSRKMLTKDDEQSTLFKSDASKFAVGPLLLKECERVTSDKVTMLVPGFLPETLRLKPQTDQVTAITFGRLDGPSARNKQSLLAITAVNQLFRDAEGHKAPPPLRSARVYVVGVPDSDEAKEEVLKQADKAAGRLTNTVLLEYIEDRAQLLKILSRCNLAMMLSWQEGFGLAGWEAIACEIPLIVSENTGLFQLIDEGLGDRGTALLKSVKIKGQRSGEHPYTKEDLRDVKSAVRAIASDMDRASKNAGNLKQLLQKKYGCTWESTAATFLNGLRPPTIEITGADRKLSWAQRDQLRGCAEMSVDCPQGSSPSLFDVVVSLRFGLHNYPREDITLRVGTTEAELILVKGDCDWEGTRYGDQPKDPNVLAVPEEVEHTIKWRVVGPLDPQGRLAGATLIGAVLCRLKAPSDLQSLAVGVILKAHKAHLRYDILDITSDEPATLSANKRAIIAAFLNSRQSDEGGWVALSVSGLVKD